MPSVTLCAPGVQRALSPAHAWVPMKTFPPYTVLVAPAQSPASFSTPRGPVPQQAALLGRTLADGSGAATFLQVCSAPRRLKRPYPVLGTQAASPRRRLTLLFSLLPCLLLPASHQISSHCPSRPPARGGMQPPCLQVPLVFTSGSRRAPALDWGKENSSHLTEKTANWLPWGTSGSIKPFCARKHQKVDVTCIPIEDMRSQRINEDVSPVTEVNCSCKRTSHKAAVRVREEVKSVLPDPGKLDSSFGLMTALPLRAPSPPARVTGKGQAGLPSSSGSCQALLPWDAVVSLK
ncbi:hypothetical protein J1605_021599 [Eschrichtius robustus]|uniref:Uncharacterized protein n=1 Tax=Eschrichtius robustus TaxID=9764 RepID=A0AB34HDR7_ESCRO|nr:hypothetical protein J1605_021599 [Eschrichtius robustus]